MRLMLSHMKLDLSFLRFVIIVQLAKSWLWGKGDETYLFHIGTFSDGDNTALKVVVLPVSICFGFIKRSDLG